MVFADSDWARFSVTPLTRGPAHTSHRPGGSRHTLASLARVSRSTSPLRLSPPLWCPALSHTPTPARLTHQARVWTAPAEPTADCTLATRALASYQPGGLRPCSRRARAAAPCCAPAIAVGAPALAPSRSPSRCELESGRVGMARSHAIPPVTALELACRRRCAALPLLPPKPHSARCRPRTAAALCSSAPNRGSARSTHGWRR